MSNVKTVLSLGLLAALLVAGLSARLPMMDGEEPNYPTLTAARDPVKDATRGAEEGSAALG